MRMYTKNVDIRFYKLMYFIFIDITHAFAVHVYIGYKCDRLACVLSFSFSVFVILHFLL